MPTPSPTTLAQARYSRLTYNAPLSPTHADALLSHLHLTAHNHIVDLGCGWGTLLLRAASRCHSTSNSNTRPEHTNDAPTWTATGVDTDPAALERGRRDAAAAVAVGALSPDRVSFVEMPAGEWRPGTSASSGVDRVICVGSSHALGGSRAMLARLAELVAAGCGGRALVGEMCWERAPTEVAREMFGEEVPMLGDLVALCRETGWEVLHLSTADQWEWDDFESRHRAGTREWLLANPDDPRVQEVREREDKRERDYLTGYRGVLGFVYLVLGR
ncbi:SAM-dependent methyltransferase [Chaetomium tenue]|uniref:SAM-dependent methyltransferase n=1 Tax=Chaetomium tenue TaxID=1854479 RepID=A0ACB7PDS7_9PEZI|nr:SAM-dependent methyltransferase [Chaetomium globosum]